MPLKRASRLILTILALALVGPFVFHTMAQGELTYEEQQEMAKAWVTSTRPQSDTLDWTRPGFGDDDWGLAESGFFEEGTAASYSQLGGWPNPDAEWIWSGRSSEVYFRRRFGLPRRLLNEENRQEKIYVWLTVNDDFIFYVNGNEIARDEIGDDDWMRVSGPHDVTEYLNVGDNVFAVWARNDLEDDPNSYGMLFHAEYRLIGSGGSEIPTTVITDTGGC